jgi:hypothetical protein
LKIIGGRGSGNLFYIPTIVRAQNINQNKFFSVRFYVYTGASVTSISDTDAIKNRINYLLCNVNPNLTKIAGGGSLRTRIIPDPEIGFLIEDNKLYIHKLERIQITDRGNAFDAVTNPTVSLLGIDVLQNFTISFRNNFVFLENL